MTFKAISAKVSANKYNEPETANRKPVLMGLWDRSPPIEPLFLSTFCRLMPQNMMSPSRIIMIAGVMVYSLFLWFNGFVWLVSGKTLICQPLMVY